MPFGARLQIECSEYDAAWISAPKSPWKISTHHDTHLVSIITEIQFQTLCVSCISFPPSSTSFHPLIDATRKHFSLSLLPLNRMSGTSASRNSNTGSHRPPWGVSWEENFKLRHAGSPQHMAFLHANAWQRDSVGLRLAGYDGFLVVVGLFLVLLLEGLLSFDPNAFESTWAGDAFLVTLVFGTAFGGFYDLFYCNDQRQAPTTDGSGSRYS